MMRMIPLVHEGFRMSSILFFVEHTVWLWSPIPLKRRFFFSATWIHNKVLWSVQWTSSYIGLRRCHHFKFYPCHRFMWYHWESYKAMLIITQNPHFIFILFGGDLPAILKLKPAILKLIDTSNSAQKSEQWTKQNRIKTAFILQKLFYGNALHLKCKTSLV